MRRLANNQKYLFSLSYEGKKITNTYFNVSSASGSLSPESAINSLKKHFMAAGINPGKISWAEKELGSSGFREVFLTIEPLQTDWHTLRMEVLDGKLCFDCFEIPTNDESPEYDSNFPDDPERAESLLDKKMPFDLKKATLPLAGAAANGLAMVFTLGKLGDKLHKLRFRRKK